MPDQRMPNSESQSVTLAAGSDGLYYAAMATNTDAHPPRPPLAFRIGVTGHRPDKLDPNEDEHISDLDAGNIFDGVTRWNRNDRNRWGRRRRGEER